MTRSRRPIDPPLRAGRRPFELAGPSRYLPVAAVDNSPSHRYDQINDFEKELVDSSTHILKFYLHISKEELLKRFEARLDDPMKQWKISESDYKERGFWDEYMTAYEEALSRCSTLHAPWFVIPSDHKWFRNLAIARVVVEHLEALDMKLPKPSVDLGHIRREYHAAKEK